jgi:uncharacterized metal-binding protein
MQEIGKCLCSSSGVRFFACSEASTVGQVAQPSGIRPGIGQGCRFFCLAGVGSHIKGMVKSGKEVDLMVA